MKPPLSDHEKDAIDEAKGKKIAAEILVAYKFGQTDKLNKLNNLNPYSRSRDYNRYLAYENGYKK